MLVEVNEAYLERERIEKLVKENNLEEIKKCNLQVDGIADTILRDANLHKKIEIVKYIVSSIIIPYSDQRDLLTTACFFGNFETVKYLISERGFDPTMDDNHPIISACQSRNLELVKYLVAVGADIRAQNNRALFLASTHGNLEIVKFLVSLGADPTADNNRAVRYAEYYCLDVVRYLVSVGADWRKCKRKYKKILKVEQIQKIFRMKIYRNIYRKLTSVYFSPNYTGGILAKKDLSNFITKLF